VFVLFYYQRNDRELPVISRLPILGPAKLTPRAKNVQLIKTRLAIYPFWTLKTSSAVSAFPPMPQLPPFTSS
jgi:hypothetical protein